jgi:ATP-dependent protease ClpP protease subunit
MIKYIKNNLAEILLLSLASVMIVVTVFNIANSRSEPKQDFSKDIVLEVGSTLFLEGSVDDDMSMGVMALLDTLAKEKKKPLYIVIDSSGGNLGSALNIMTMLNTLERPTVGICIKCMSGAFDIFRSLDFRYAIHSSQIMQHHASSWQYLVANQESKQSSAETFKLVDKLHLSLSVPFRDPSANDYIEHSTVITSQEALRIKWIDKIVNIKCSEALTNMPDERVFKSDEFILLVAKPKCPLSDKKIITGAFMQYQGQFVPLQLVGMVHPDPNLLGRYIKHLSNEALEADFEKLPRK